MSKKETSSSDPAVIDDNSAQVNGTREIVENHDSQAVNLLRKEQARASQRMKERRHEGHHEYELIEAQAHAILQRAHKEGEVHIATRHTSTPTFFYVVDPNVLMMWSDGKSEKIGPIPDFVTNSQFRVIKYLVTIDAKKVDGGIASMVCSTQLSRLAVFLIGKSTNGSYWIKPAGNPDMVTLPQNVEDLIFSDNGVYGGSWESKITTWVAASTGNMVTVLAQSSVQAPYRSVVLHDARKGHDNIFLINKSQIRSIPRTNNAKNATEILGEGIAKIPIDLAIHSNNNALLIQDVGKKEIGLFLMDSEQERVWRSFAIDSQITLNQGVFQSDQMFTISCLLKRNCKQGLTDAPLNADPFKIWVDKKSGLLNLQYKSGAKSYNFVSPEGKKLTEFQYSDWFLFTMQKERNEIRFYIDGEVFCSFQTENFPSLRSAKKVLFSMPGFFICELRIWRTIRTPEQLKRFKRTWIPHSEYDGLSGYWHLFVRGNDKDATGLIWEKLDKNGKVIELQQEPDLTGNGNHLITNSKTLKIGDLNLDTVIKDKAPSPFPKVIPIYGFGVIQQGLRIDDNTGLIYWMEEIGETCNRRCVIMVGSALGHLPPRVVLEVATKRRFSMLSQFNSKYETLMIAHAERRAAMEKHIMGIGDQHRESHSAVQSAHDDLTNELSKSEMEVIDNMVEYTKVHDEWLHEMNRIVEEEEHALRTASTRRNNAIATAIQMTDTAQMRVIAHRKNRDWV